MKIAIVAAGFTPAEADQLRRAMATFRRDGTIQTFQDKMIEGMAAKRLRRATSPSAASTRSRGSANTAFPRAMRRASRCSSMPRAGSSATIPMSSPRRCSTPSRWASTPRPRSSATRASTASRCARSTSTCRTGTARWSRSSPCGKAPSLPLRERVGGRSPPDEAFAPSGARTTDASSEPASPPTLSRKGRGDARSTPAMPRWRRISARRMRSASVFGRSRASRRRTCAGSWSGGGGLRFGARPLAAQRPHARGDRAARRRRRLPLARPRPARRRCGRCAASTGSATRTICRCSRAARRAKRSPTRACRRCRSASMWSTTTAACRCR